MNRKRNIKLRKALLLFLAAAVCLSAGNTAYPSPISSYALRAASHANSPLPIKELLARRLSGDLKPAAKLASAGNAQLRTDLKAVIFDLDGVIIDSASIHFNIWKDIFEDEFSRPAYNYGDREFTYEEFLEKVFGRSGIEALRNVLIEHDEIEIEGLAMRKRSLFIEKLMSEDIEVIGPVTALIKQLRTQGIRIGVATSLRQTDIILKRLGIRGLFDVIVNPAMAVSRGQHQNSLTKRDIYISAARKLGVRSIECIAFEDSQPGIEAAKEAGMLCIGIASAGASSLEHAANEVLDPAELSVERVRSIYESKASLEVGSLNVEIGEHLKQILALLGGQNPLSRSIEPRISWESMVYYLLTDKFFLSTDRFDRSMVTYPPRTDPFVDGCISYTTLDLYRDPASGHIYYESDMLRLPQNIQARSVPAYIIHVQREDLDKYRDPAARKDFLSKLFIHEWIEHFMPYFYPAGSLDRDTPPHKSLFKYAGERRIKDAENTLPKSKPGTFYDLLDSYLVFEDPSGVYKRQIFEELERIEKTFGAGFLANSIKNRSDLIAWYSYQFEHKGLTVQQFSALLSQYAISNRVIAENLKVGGSSCFFQVIHPQTNQTLYLPQNMPLRDNENLEEVEFASDDERQVAINEISRLEVRKGLLKSQMGHLQGEKRGQLFLLEDDSLDGSMRLATEGKIDQLNSQIINLNDEIRETSQREIYVYASRLIRNIQQKIESEGEGKEPLIVAIWGGSSTGKNTFCEICSHEFYARHLYKPGEILVIGSDNYLHAGSEGRYHEHITTDGTRRFCILQGQGIFGLKVFNQDLATIMSNQSILLYPDHHDHAYEATQTFPVVVGQNVQLILANLASLGIDDAIRSKVDLLIAVTFSDGKTQFERMVVRDRQDRQEGGMRAFTFDELLKRFVTLWFLENKQAMHKTMFTQADFIWDQDGFRLYQVRRKGSPYTANAPVPQPVDSDRLRRQAAQLAEIASAA